MIPAHFLRATLATLALGATAALAADTEVTPEN